MAQTDRLELADIDGQAYTARAQKYDMCKSKTDEGPILFRGRRKSDREGRLTALDRAGGFGTSVPARQCGRRLGHVAIHAWNGANPEGLGAEASTAERFAGRSQSPQNGCYPPGIENQTPGGQATVSPIGLAVADAAV